MKKDVKMLTEVLDIVSKKRKQLNFDSNAARNQIAIEVIHELRKRRCQINKIELWTRKRQINTYNLTIVNEKTPNKHFFSPGYSFTYDDQKNEWQELSHNFYFLEEEDGETYYFNAEDGKIFFYDSSDE